jgi:redox-sensitive bicupin YhaK (pirin superfamily)
MVHGIILPISFMPRQPYPLPMMTLRRSKERFHTRIDWLDSRHTFSFGEHHHPDHMGFRALRVINDDTVKAGAGFGTHGHRDMEIISYVLDGALSHRDSMGNGSTIRPGDVQRMSAGTGVMHSEQNAQRDAATHFLQIWIIPERRGLTPGYEQKSYSVDERRGRLRLIAARDGRDGAVTVHQDVAIYSAILEPGQTVEHTLAPGRHAWVHVARGAATVNGQPLATGDGAAISDETRVAIAGTEPSEVLVFDLA